MGELQKELEALSASHEAAVKRKDGVIQRLIENHEFAYDQHTVRHNHSSGHRGTPPQANGCLLRHTTSPRAPFPKWFGVLESPSGHTKQGLSSRRALRSAASVSLALGYPPCHKGYP